MEQKNKREKSKRQKRKRKKRKASKSEMNTNLIGEHIIIKNKNKLFEESNYTRKDFSELAKQFYTYVYE